MSTIPQTKYAHSGDVSIAYQVIGKGPLDLILVPGWVSNIELSWEQPDVAQFLRRLASFSRLILFDKRGTGLSDRSTGIANLETRMDDVRAVMDAVGSERAALFGYSEGGSMCCLFSATYPKRVSALIVSGGYAKRIWAPDYPAGVDADEFREMIEVTRQNWGGPVRLDTIAPSRVGDASFAEWFARYLRLSASPAAAAAVNIMNAEIDIRHILPTISVPTLILHSVGDKTVLVENGRYLSQHIPGANFVEMPGSDHTPFGSDGETVLDEISEFLTGERREHEPERVLATVLFTDIVGSTEKAVALGDHDWGRLLESHHAAVRRELAQFRGREIDTAGDGFLASFDGPARAIRCARAIGHSVKSLGLEIRAGLHTGECELMDGGIGGIAVHIGSRVAGLAAAGEVLVSSTVKDLVAGSGIEFAELGVRPLKGVPGEWRLFRVDSA